MTLPPFHAFSIFVVVPRSLPSVALGLPQPAPGHDGSGLSLQPEGILAILREMGHLGCFLPSSCCEAPFHPFSFSFPPLGTEWVQAVQHPALTHAWLTAFIMSLIRTQPLEELLGFRVLCCRVPEGMGGREAGKGAAIIQERWPFQVCIFPILIF